MERIRDLCPARAGQCHCPRVVLGVLGALWDGWHVGLGWEWPHRVEPSLWWETGGSL